MQSEAESAVRNSLDGKTVILGVTGSIAAYKAAEIASSLTQLGADVHVIMTASATNLVAPATFRALTRNPVTVSVWDEPKSEEIVHVQLPERADLLLIAPATANIIGKLAHGIADDMLTTAALVARCPLLIAPAMNPRMYCNRVVEDNISRLKELGWQFIEPDIGRMACGDEGIGRLADPQTIVARTVSTLQSTKCDMAGIRVLVTAGPTREPIDPVRYISNQSSGKMGHAIAEAAASRKATVTLITGPTDLAAPAGVNSVRVQTAEEMLNATMKALSDADIVIAAAAVADYRPASKAEQKIKKHEERMQLDLEKTEDILSRIAADKGKRIVVGFAAETENIEDNARKKLSEKNLDLIVANDVSDSAGVFGSDSNTVTLISRTGHTLRWPKSLKQEIANRIFNYIMTELREESA